jgi:hypothetical protein
LTARSIELILRNRLALQDGGKRLELQGEQSTGVGVLDDVAALVKKSTQGGEGCSDNLSDILSRIAGVQLVAQPGLWDKIKDVFKVRWPIGAWIINQPSLLKQGANLNDRSLSSEKGVQWSSTSKTPVLAIC